MRKISGKKKFLYSTIAMACMSFITAMPFGVSSYCKNKELKRFKSVAETLDRKGCRKTRISESFCGGKTLSSVIEIPIEKIEVSKKSCTTSSDFLNAGKIQDGAGAEDKAKKMYEEARKLDENVYPIETGTSKLKSFFIKHMMGISAGFGVLGGFCLLFGVGFYRVFKKEENRQ
jgi:hypothetical protein